ncbi:TlyA family RNA methyltransferase [Desulfococcaceae bacterium HSG9]|nr:TlyA family RNA methyltransferase [Desulfococcaceae bacterium HSG9]
MTVTSRKVRLDMLVVNLGLAQSRQRARAMIMAGKVLVNNLPITKPGSAFADNAVIRLKAGDIPYVSRGGLKLEKALNEYHLNVKGMTCLDVGASTGGFTDCLLKHGAERVYAVDVGYGQLAWQLRQDKRVVVIERTNIRYMPAESVPDPIDLITIDVSFISLKIVIPAVRQFMQADTRIIALIKPQFEVGKKKIGKGGVVRDPAMHTAVIDELTDYFQKHELECEPVLTSPVQGPKGNKEFLILMRPAN